VEKINTYEGISVKVLLDFMSKKYAERRGFKLIKLEKLILVRNIDGTGNSEGAICMR